MNGTGYKYWGNNVYSVVLPVPRHRNFDEICIEHYYNDNNLRTKDGKGRRILLSTEFDKKTGKHLVEDLIYVNKKDLVSPYPKIIDKLVFKGNGENVALSKNYFAELILKQEPNEISFEYFSDFFDLLSIVITHNDE